MKDFLHTLIKPDWDDNPKRSEILNAANLLQIGEFQLIQLAYKVWYKENLPEDKINKIFEEYMIRGIIPIWVTYYARDIIKLDNANVLNGYDEKYHVYDHEFGEYIYNDKHRRKRGIQYAIIIILVFIFYQQIFWQLQQQLVCSFLHESLSAIYLHEGSVRFFHYAS